MQTATLLLAIISAIGSFIAAFYSYRSVYVVIGLFATRVFPKAKQQHKYAVVIAARNEERMIGNLLDSIRRQDYPSELVTMFVVADNCTDATASVARAHGAICYERFDDAHRTKGYALQFLFENIRRDYGIESFEGYFIFDADNLLKQDFISRMNEAFDSGERIVTSYRNTKNIDDNWIAHSYAMHWMRTIRTEHRARSVLGLATRIQGTGLLVASSLLKNGWNYVTLTEDRELCAEAVVMGCPVSFCNAAEFYDEQPTSLRIALRQRIRWSKGHLQVVRKVAGRLFCHIFRAGDVVESFMSYDMLTIVLPHSLFSSFVRLAKLAVCLCVWLFTAESFGYFGGAVLTWLLGIGKSYLSAIVTAVYVSIMERSHIKPMPLYKKVWFCLTFPIFDLIGRLSMLIALVTRVEWKPIPHTVEASIDDMRQPAAKK